MLYAISQSGEKVNAIKGGKARCPYCGGEVIPKCGEIVIHHWAHQTSRDCDNWSEGETLWHLEWKKLFPKNNVEVNIGKNGIIHRADIVDNSGTIIELQHSFISPIEIATREKFYVNMIWIFDLSDRRDAFEQVHEKVYIPEAAGFLAFKWNHLRISYLACKKPIYIDYSVRNMLKVYAILPDGYGFGKFVDKAGFIRKHAAVNISFIPSNLLAKHQDAPTHS
jgi:hypothetical protein